MPVLINFKICDNSEDCSGITICSTGAFYWDGKNKTIAVDNSECVLCGDCETSCPVGAIRVARNEDEYARLRREIDEDPRKVSDLFIDRYGAQPIHPAFSIPQSKFDVQIIRSTKLAVVEFFNRDSIRCLLRSIPIKELLGHIDVKYRKMPATSDLMQSYGVTVLPALLFFMNGEMIGRIDGYYDIERKEELIARINNIVAKTK